MKKLVERSIFLRTFNYVRIDHGYWAQFNIWTPSVLTVGFSGLLFFLNKDTNIFGPDGVLRQLAQLLAILSPFFIASLAAVATFPAGEKFDQNFKMVDPVRIDFLEEDVWRERHLTVRQFLSMLFGYCSMVSLILFLISLLSPLIADGIASMIGGYSAMVSWLGFVAFLFLFFHMITATVFALYYLSDKMHRS